MIFDGDEEKKKEKNIKTESEVQERHQKKGFLIFNYFILSFLCENEAGK